MDFGGIYNGKTVLVTGHTGFKGSWLCMWLNKLGAKVIGYSLEEYDNDYLFRKARLSSKLIDERGDVRDFKRLKEVFDKHNPEVVFHLAAQPLVRLSYDIPRETIEVNVIGTTNVLDLVKSTESVNVGVIITTDKCYKNKEFVWGYRETDELGGVDTYSASKASMELIVEAYRHSFFKDGKKLVASVRAGNVIGGGDQSKDRLLPECMGFFEEGKEVIIRSPKATRPWQFVLDPLEGYLKVGQKLLEGNAKFSDAWNFGPDFEACVSVEDVVKIVSGMWGGGKYVVDTSRDGKHESTYLMLDASKAKTLLKWKPRTNLNQALSLTTDWYKREGKEDAFALCMEQINQRGEESD